MSRDALLRLLGPPIADAAEEIFLLFSQDIPSSNLGFVDASTDHLEFEIGGRDYVVKQSPGLLHSDRKGGTTGAVVWKITPLVASWLVSMPPLLTNLGVLRQDVAVVELGCGIAGLIGLAVAPHVNCYVLTDQEYVMKRLRDNIASNASPHQQEANGRRGANRGHTPRDQPRGSLHTVALDWETDRAENLAPVLRPSVAVDLVILCDCIYNEYLVAPLVQTCVDVSQLRTTDDRPVLLIAQQLRSDRVCEVFLEALMASFEVWRATDNHLPPPLQSGTGYVVHLALLRDETTPGEEPPR